MDDKRWPIDCPDCGMVWTTCDPLKQLGLPARCPDCRVKATAN